MMWCVPLILIAAVALVLGVWWLTKAATED